MAGDEIVSSSYRLTPILTSIINGHDAAVKIMLEYAGKLFYISDTNSTKILIFDLKVLCYFFANSFCARK